MPTNEERREVARRLRETSDEIRYWYDTNPYWYVMKCIYGDVKIHDDNELFYRLADLIEPEPERTCNRVKLYDTGGVWYEGCSKCRNQLDDYDVYCSKCGAKVLD